MSIHVLKPSGETDPIQQTKIDLAAAHRLAALHELEEGIDNHFTVTVPGYEDRYLILPFGFHWSEAKASDMLQFDDSGATVEGEGIAEMSAVCIHAPVHRICSARVVLHTHQTWATALNMLEDNRLIYASQTSAYFHGSVAYDDTYNGGADTLEEGERLAHKVGNAHTLFMKNHGVLVVGDYVAQAFKRLYMLERVCRTQLLAMGAGERLAPIPDDIIAGMKTPVGHDPHGKGERTRLYFDAMKRVLDRELPGYEQ